MPFGWLKNLLSSSDERTLNRYRDRLAEVHEVAEGLTGHPEGPKAKVDEARERLNERMKPFNDRVAEISDEIQTASGPLSRLEAQLNDAADARERALDAALNEVTPLVIGAAVAASRHLLGKEVRVVGETLTWDMVPYDVQILGAMAMLDGHVIEMATGEGKTLVAALALAVKAITGRPVHLVTVNPYLSQRDSEWMGVLYEALGLTVGCIDVTEPTSEARQRAYQQDITYGMTSEFGFDYLRDHMAKSRNRVVQRGLWFAIVDEADSVLIDEARTPLIISGKAEQDDGDLYDRLKPDVRKVVSEQNRIVSELLGDAQGFIDQGDLRSAADLLAVARRGLPRHKRLAKIMSTHPELQDLVQEVEMRTTRERSVAELEQDLLFAVDEEEYAVRLTDEGYEMLSGGDPEAFEMSDVGGASAAEIGEKAMRAHIIHQLLRAYGLMSRDDDYVVQGGQVKIVDESTGRTLEGRRWSNGLQQAVETKEGVERSNETQTMATISIQNFFRLYDQLSGMTGTAISAEQELKAVYDVPVLEVPTHRPVIREDRQDLVYQTRREKLQAVVDEVGRLNRLELPVLVGTASVEASETLSRLLRRAGLKHQVLNAKRHEKEAKIVSKAGEAGTVTVATNMAGRGTDIRLADGVTEPRTAAWLRERGLDVADHLPPDSPLRSGGHENLSDDHVVEVGGLHVIGSERHEAQRIDRQLRGRAGRQGAPGRSQFFVSLEDDLLRLFGSERVSQVLNVLGAKEGEAMSGRFIQKVVDKAQDTVTGERLAARKRILEYDDVLDTQRRLVYEMRDVALMADGVLPEVLELVREVRPEVLDVLVEATGTMEEPEPVVALAMLKALDARWQEHLATMDHLRNSIHWRGYGQKDPVREYQMEAIDLFEDFWHDVIGGAIRRLDPEG